MENEIVVAEVQTEEVAGLKFNKASFELLVAQHRELTDRVIALESKNQTSSTKREMTIEDATRVTSGDLRNKTHKEAFTELGLSYGQVYSARIGATFKGVHRDMIEQGLTDIWTKKK